VIFKVTIVWLNFALQSQLRRIVSQTIYSAIDLLTVALVGSFVRARVSHPAIECAGKSSIDQLYTRSVPDTAAAEHSNVAQNVPATRRLPARVWNEMAATKTNEKLYIRRRMKYGRASHLFRSIDL
jgi:hypothetical protein